MIISYELVDDAFCELDDTLDVYEDCTQCPLFYDCMNVMESADTNYTIEWVEEDEEENI